MRARRRLLAPVAVAAAAISAASTLGGGPGGPGGCDAAQAAAPSGDVERALDCRKACLAQRSGFRSLSVKGRRGGLRVRFRRRARRPVRVAVLRVTRGRRVVPGRRVASFRGRRRSFAWSGTARGRAVPSGYYVVRVAIGREVRHLAFTRRAGRFTSRPPFARAHSCDSLSAFRLSAPVFGGSRRTPLRMGYRLSRPGTVALTVRRGRKVVRRIRSRRRSPGRTYRVVVRAGPRGEYRVALSLRVAGRRTVVSRLGARSLR